VGVGVFVVVAADVLGVLFEKQQKYNKTPNKAQTRTKNRREQTTDERKEQPRAKNSRHGHAECCR
jgi:hypothetical protein